MFSIGFLSKQAGVKVPTIRYYEQIGLITPLDRTQGNQRRYGELQRERLVFIKHARELGFSIEAIGSLIELGNDPGHSCAKATDIAKKQLGDVSAKIASLVRLESELLRITEVCSGTGVVSECNVLSALADHDQCVTSH